LFLYNFTMFPICFFLYNKACNWNIGFLQIVNIPKLYHILGSNHSTFYVWSFQVSFPYKNFSHKNANPSINEIHVENNCLPSSRCSSFPRISPNSLLIHQVLSHKLPKPVCTWNFQKCQYTISAVFDISEMGSKIKI
jgi:hypothetical protein